MKQNFERALTHVLKFEGGYSNLAADPGGATNLGITQAELARYRGHPVDIADVKALAIGEVGEIYRIHYWAPMRCDELPGGIDLAVFDCAVNQGTGRAGRFLQEAVGASVDNVVGPKTLAAVHNADAEAVLIEFMARRANGYGLLQQLFRVFGLGWSRRLIKTTAVALAMAAAPQARPPLAAAA